MIEKKIYLDDELTKAIERKAKRLKVSFSAALRILVLTGLAHDKV